ncbi:MAG: immunoglobulin domain-containing protein [Ignavibacteria bacterium]|nr:immunoglobulin domain-containing protein [Ignavibacteria bacterium]
MRFSKLFSSALLLLILFLATSNYTLLSQITRCESFDGTTFPPSGWSRSIGSGSYNWERLTSGRYPSTSPYSGAGMAGYYSYSASSGSWAILVTPAIDWSQRGSATPTVSFYMYRDPGYSSSPDSVIVWVNTQPNLTNATRLGAVHRYAASASWNYYSYNIPSGFNGSTNYIIFQAYSGFGNDMYIDEVCYVEYPSTMTYRSSRTLQVVGGVGRGFTNQPIIALEVTTEGSASPLTLSSITFNTTGTTNTADITAARVFYTGTSSTFSTSTQFGSTISSPSGTFTVTGSQTLAAGTNYFWLAYDISSTASEGNLLDAQCTSFRIGTTDYTPSITNPTGAREVRGPRIGTYTVGTGQYYQTLSEAFYEINTFGMRGNVTLLIMTDITETPPSQPVLNQWTEYDGSGYTLTIRPSGGSRTISGSYSGTAVVVLYGADRVIIDGSIGGSGRHLTIRNDATSATAGVPIGLWSLGTNQGCTNVTIRNCNLIAIGRTTSQTSSIGLYVDGADHDFLTIENNAISRCYQGIYIAGVSGATIDSLRIIGNIIGSDNSADYVGFRGINLLRFAPGARIMNNTVYNIIRNDGTNIAAIELGQDNRETQIVGNRIYGIYQESSGGWGAYGINVTTSTGNSDILIANNMIYDIHTMNYSVSSTIYNPFGIRLTGGTNYKIYHNTIHMYGNQANVGSSASMSACLIITSTGVTGTDLRNNIFANGLGSAISGSKMYTVYVPSGYTFSTINYNNYYAYGSYGILGFYGGDRTSLSAWRTSSGGDANSTDLQPVFIANNDLHLTGSTIGDNRFLAPTISGITIDFDRETRRTSSTVIGCDEVVPFITTTPVAFSPLRTVYCRDGSVTMSTTPSITGYADGISRTVTSPAFSYQWTRNSSNIPGATGSTLTLSPIVQADSATYGCIVSFFGVTTTATERHLRVESPIAIVTHPSNSSICIDRNPTITLTSSSTGTITGWQWQKRDANNPNVWINIPGATGPNLIQPISNPAEATGFYRVLVLGPGNCGPAQVASNSAYVDVTETVKNNVIRCDKDPTNICETDNFTLTTSAHGTITGYQWQKNVGGAWQNLDIEKFPTARSRTLEFRIADPSMSGEYRLLVYGSPACYPTGEGVPSNVISVTVWPLFNIAKQPVSQAACPNDDVMLFVVTEGVVLNYQWQKDGVDILDNPSARTPVLTMRSVKFENSGVYRCRLTIQDCRGVRPVFTDEVLVYVHSRTKITKANKQQIVKVGDVAMFSFDANVEGIKPSGDVIIQWYRGNFALEDNDRISGSKSNVLTIRDVRPSDIASDYWVYITGHCGSDTARGFSITVPSITITKQPENVTACESQTASFSVEATFTNGTELKYQWRKDGVPLTDNGRVSGSKSSTLTISNLMLADAGSYDVVLTLPPTNYQLVSSSASLFVNMKPRITQQPPASINLNVGQTLTLTVDADGSQPFTYQWYKNGQPIPGANSATYEKANVTSEDAGTYYCKVSNSCGEVNSSSAVVTVTFRQVAGVTEVVNDIQLEQNKPNPFATTTSITFTVPSVGKAKLVLVDTYGRVLANLFDANVHGGTYSIEFDPVSINLASGVYFYKLNFNGIEITKQMIYLK